MKYFNDKKYTFLIFSDDIEYCKTIKFGNIKILFSEGNKNSIDLLLMSLCDHHIIANSSFSFWGALLNSKKNKKVLCPKNYIGGKDNMYCYMNDLWFPEDWISLNII